MLSLGELKPGLSLVGLEPNAIATVVAVVAIGANAVRVIYTTPDGTLKDRLLNSADEPTIGPATAEIPWSFDGDGGAFLLTCEAKRIDLAFLFDQMMAVHTSNVEPLPVAARHDLRRHPPDVLARARRLRQAPSGGPGVVRHRDGVAGLVTARGGKGADRSPSAGRGRMGPGTRPSGGRDDDDALRG
jgi:hypothetical protein